MAKVFICYRREDSIETAGRMYSWLTMRLHADNVFMDVNTIAPGVNFPDAIAHVISTQAEIVLAIIGRAWLRTTDEQGNVRERLREPDDHVRREIELALTQNKPIIPVLVQGATMPSQDELPESIAVLAYINALPVRPEPDFDNDMRRLRQAIVDLGASLAFHPPIAVSTTPPPPQWNRESPGAVGYATNYPGSPTTPGSLWTRLFRKRRPR